MPSDSNNNNGRPPKPKTPPGWEVNWDPNYETYYFVNLKTGTSQWDQPTSPATPDGGKTQNGNKNEKQKDEEDKKKKDEENKKKNDHVDTLYVTGPMTDDDIDDPPVSVPDSPTNKYGHGKQSDYPPPDTQLKPHSYGYSTLTSDTDSAPPNLNTSSKKQEIGKTLLAVGAGVFGGAALAKLIDHKKSKHKDSDTASVASSSSSSSSDSGDENENYKPSADDKIQHHVSESSSDSDSSSKPNVMYATKPSIDSSGAAAAMAASAAGIAGLKMSDKPPISTPNKVTIEEVEEPETVIHVRPPPTYPPISTVVAPEIISPPPAATKITEYIPAQEVTTELSPVSSVNSDGYITRRVQLTPEEVEEYLSKQRNNNSS